MDWIDTATLQQVAATARAGDRIPAIRDLRLATYGSLRQAVTLVDELARHGDAAEPPADDSTLADVDPALRRRLLFLLVNGRRSEAVRTMMSSERCDAGEARDRLASVDATGWKAALGESELAILVQAANTGGIEAAAAVYADLTGVDETVALSVVSALQMHPRPPAHPDPAATERLVAAIQTGTVEAARAALDDSADPNAVTGDSDVLGEAAALGQLALIELLLDRGAGITGRTPDQRSPLRRALAAGQDDAATLLLRRGAPVDGGEESTLSLLLSRPDPPSVGLLDALPAHGASVNTDHLVQAIERGWETVVVHLLKAGADPNGRCQDHYTPLMAAANRGAEPLVRLLLDHGALLNSRGSGGVTALHLAVAAGDDGACALLLVTRGADTHARNCNRETPIRLARKLGRQELADALHKASLEAGPRWMRDARKAGIERLTLYYHKADGLAFYPHDIERCVLLGGDYDGARPTSAGLALEWLLARPHPPQADRLIPFLRLVDAGEDFPLSDMISACNPRVERMP